MTISCLNKSIIALVLTGAVALGTSGIASAAGSGSTPKGKPFVEIQGVIAEVKLDISTLEARHDAIEARVKALEDAGFQAQIDFLTSEIARLDAENLDRIAEIEDIVAAAALTDIDVAFADVQAPAARVMDVVPDERRTLDREQRLIGIDGAAASVRTIVRKRAIGQLHGAARLPNGSTTAICSIRSKDAVSDANDA